MSLWHTIYIVDWNIVLDLYNKDILERTLLYSREDPPDWAEVYNDQRSEQAPSLYGGVISDLPISHNLHIAVAQAYEQLSLGLPIDTKEQADALILSLISFQGYHQDLEHKNWLSLVGSLNPKTIIKLAILAEEIEWNSFKDPYYKLCDQSTRKTIATYTDCQGSDKSFNKGFLFYIEEEWLEPIYLAAHKKQGIFD